LELARARNIELRGGEDAKTRNYFSNRLRGGIKMNYIFTNRTIRIGLFSLLIRMGRHTVKRGNRPAKLALIAAFLLLVSSGSMVFGAGLDEYVIGSGGDFECFPQREWPDCDKVNELSGASKTIYEVLKACAARAEDKTTLQKFVMAGSLLFFWHPAGLALAKQAWSDVPYEIVACLTNGLVSASHLHPDEAKAIEDLVNGIETLRDTTMDIADARAWFNGVKKVEVAARAWEAWELGSHAGDIKEISQLRRMYEKADPAAEVTRRLAEAERLSRDVCAFDLALGELELRLDHSRNLVLGFKAFLSALAEPSDQKQDEDPNPLRTVAIGTRRIAGRIITDNPQAQRYYDLQDTLAQMRSSILHNLEKFHEIKQMRKVIEERKEFFLRRRQEYEATALIAKAALNEGDLKTACHAILGLKSIKDKATEGYINCPDKVAPNLEQLESRVWDLLHVKIAEVERLLDYAENAINSDTTDEARRALGTAREKIPLLVGPAGNQCSPPLEAPQLWDRLEKLEKRLQEKRTTSKDITGKWYAPGNPTYTATISMSGNSCSYTGTDGNYKHTGTLSYDETVFEGEAKDVSGFCCGNEGYIWLKVVDENTLEIKSKWWKPENKDRTIVEAGWDTLKRDNR